MLRSSLLAGLLCLAGCSTPHVDHGVPNLVQVRPDVWRSGQPASQEAWDYLVTKLGIAHVIKLDFEEEGSDDVAASMGLDVHRVAIEPSTKAGFPQEVVNLFAMPDRSRLEELQILIERIKAERGIKGAWLIHCYNGHDRTGLVVGMVRVIVDGWDKHHAWTEMLDRGFHPELIGLDRAFHEFSVEK